MTSGILYNMPNASVFRAIARQNHLWLGIACLTTLYVGYRSLVPGGMDGAIPHLDKLVHFAAYFVMAGLFVAGLPKSKPTFICAGLILLGACLEILQLTMDLGRTASLLDGLANSIGAVLGTAFATWFYRTLK